MKKLFAGLASVTFAMSAWGQSHVRAYENSLIHMPLAECGEAISHPDSILVQQGLSQHGFSYAELPNSIFGTTVLVLRSTGGIHQGYYYLAHEVDTATMFPIRTICNHFGFENIF